MMSCTCTVGVPPTRIVACRRSHSGNPECSCSSLNAFDEDLSSVHRREVSSRSADSLTTYSSNSLTSAPFGGQRSKYGSTTSSGMPEIRLPLPLLHRSPEDAGCQILAFIKEAAWPILDHAESV